jgi:signal transduction histidine kinase
MLPRNSHHSIFSLPSLTGYFAIVSVTILNTLSLDPGLQRMVGSGLFVLFGIVYTLAILQQKSSPRVLHIYVAIMTAIVAGLMAIRPMWSSIPILFFVLSALVMLFFSQRVGFIWILIFTLVTALVFLLEGNLFSGMVELLPFIAGYLFFGAFARSLAVANEARRESQVLYQELQIAHNQLQEYAAQVEELAVAEERNRLAREMHDTLGHRLTVAAVQLEGAQRLIADEPHRATEMVATVREQVREALSELRRTVATLREPLQTDLSLTHSLIRLTASFEEATGLKIHLTVPQDGIDLPDTHRLTLYRAAQEALTNVQRHARAANVWVELVIAPHQVILQISDDGIGYSGEEETAGFGLRGLRERVSQLDGTLQIEARPKGGTQLRFVLPNTMEHAND